MLGTHFLVKNICELVCRHRVTLWAPQKLLRLRISSYLLRYELVWVIVRRRQIVHVQIVGWTWPSSVRVIHFPKRARKSPRSGFHFFFSFPPPDHLCPFSTARKNFFLFSLIIENFLSSHKRFIRSIKFQTDKSRDDRFAFNFHRRFRRIFERCVDIVSTSSFV